MIWKKIQAIIEQVFDMKFDIKTDSIRQDIEEIKDRIKYIPTKEEYFVMADKIYGELQKMREEQAVMLGSQDHLEDHEARIRSLEVKMV